MSFFWSLFVSLLLSWFLSVYVFVCFCFVCFSFVCFCFVCFCFVCFCFVCFCFVCICSCLYLLLSVYVLVCIFFVPESSNLELARNSTVSCKLYLKKIYLKMIDNFYNYFHNLIVFQDLLLMVIYYNSIDLRSIVEAALKNQFGNERN